MVGGKGEPHVLVADLDAAPHPCSDRAFGPTFMFPLIVSMAGKEPVHMPFASLITVTITEKVTLPVALSMAASGIGLILTPHIDFFGTAWLIASIVVYVLALLYSVFVPRPAGEGG